MPIENVKVIRQQSDRWVFYYDGNCGFCSTTVKLLSRADLLKQVSWIPYQTLERPPDDLSWDDLDIAAYLETGSGRLHRGFYAFRMLTLRVLLLVPLIPLFWFPGVRIAGVPVYGWMAKNRHRISRCQIPLFNNRNPRQSE